MTLKYLGIGGYQCTTGDPGRGRGQDQEGTPDRIISDIIELQREYCCISVESVSQEFLRTELVKRSAQLGVPVPARGLLPIADKVLRIESLQPHMHNGLIRPHRSQTTLVDPFRHFPRPTTTTAPTWSHAVDAGRRVVGAAAAQGGNISQARAARGMNSPRMFRRARPGSATEDQQNPFDHPPYRGPASR